MPIWPGAVPDAPPFEKPEECGTVVDSEGNKRLVAGRPWVYVARVSHPTMTVYSPEGIHTGAAVVVFPGGGYNVLAIDLEGTEIQVGPRTPPTFLLQAEDDPVDPVENSLVYYAALRKAGVPAEMHVYVKGGHAFGLRRTESPITAWPELMEKWLGAIGMIAK